MKNLNFLFSFFFPLLFHFLSFPFFSFVINIYRVKAGTQSKMKGLLLYPSALFPFKKFQDVLISFF